MHKLLVLGLLVVSNAHAAHWTSVFDRLVSEKFSGYWASDKSWKGWLCDGGYKYDAALKGEVTEATYEQESETAAILTAEARDIDAHAAGSYQASKTLCIPFHLGIGVKVEDFVSRVRVTVEGPAMETIRVRVLETKFGRIRFGKSTPKEVDELLTRLVNTALDKVWSSWLGEWISKKIAPFIDERF